MSASDVAEIYALLRVGPITEVSLAEVAALAAANGISLETLKSIVALAYAKRDTSRFDLLNPSMFSTLWGIKTKAKAMEARGENTDELWRQYWDVFQRAAVLER